MKICILWHCPYPWDIRIEKFCKAFVSEGYEVSLICRGKNGEKTSEKISDINIYRVFPPKWLNKCYLTFPLFFNPIWITSVKNFLIKIKPDLLIVRDIPMAYLAGSTAKSLKIPVILDMAENYPAALMAYNNKLYAPFLFGNAALPKFYEKRCLKLMNHIIVVSREQRERLRNIGVNKDNISIVMNTPDLDYYNRLTDKVVHTQNTKKLIYVGKVDAHRGVDVLIKGVTKAAKAIPEISLTIVGSGTEIENMKRLSKELGANNFTKFTDWISFEKIPSLIRDSDIGVIPHLKSEHTDTTIPNKLFDYMAYAKPVITSDINPVAKIVSEIGCGKVFRSKDSDDLAEKLIELIKYNNIKQMGKNGLLAVKKEYNWGNDKNLLINTVTATISGMKKN